MAKPLVAVLCVLLVIEEINVGPPLSLNRLRELAWLEAVPPPPAGCRAFFVSAARPGTYMGAALTGLISHNIDAMLIAETKGLPTINGSSTFMPPGWYLEKPSQPAYQELVGSYAARYNIGHLCALNLQTDSWTR
jgi:hypothetical protein